MIQLHACCCCRSSEMLMKVSSMHALHQLWHMLACWHMHMHGNFACANDLPCDLHACMYIYGDLDEAWHAADMHHYIARS